MKKYFFKLKNIGKVAIVNSYEEVNDPGQVKATSESNRKIYVYRAGKLGLVSIKRVALTSKWPGKLHKKAVKFKTSGCNEI